MAVEAPYSGERIVDPSVLASRIEAISNSVEGAAAHFGSFWFDAPIPAGLDPLSPAYRDAVLAQYRMVAGRDYALQREAHTFDVLHDHDFIARPWPYNTGAAEQVGTMMAALGFVISAIRPRSGHRVLEMGAGWGNLALPLAQMGCNVTALDIEKRYTHILRERSMRTGVDLRVVQAPFLEAGRLFDGERFDLVVFNAAFHHCHDHIALLGLIRDQLLARGGRLVLAGEPLLEALHYPWGLNPSGEGIWAVRTHGWLELVFRPSYLIHALDDCGFDAALTTCEFSPMGNVIVAHRRVTTTLRPGKRSMTQNPIFYESKQAGLSTEKGYFDDGEDLDLEALLRTSEADRRNQLTVIQDVIADRDAWISYFRELEADRDAWVARYETIRNQIIASEHDYPSLSNIARQLSDERDAAEVTRPG